MNAYDVLGIPFGSDEATARTAFRKAAQKWHPDKFSKAPKEEQAEANAKFLEAKKALDQILDDLRKGTGGGNPFEDIFNDFFNGAFSKGADFTAHADISLSEAFKGGTATVDVQYSGKCPRCNGRNAGCAGCGGIGQLHLVATAYADFPAGVASGTLIRNARMEYTTKSTTGLPGITVDVVIRAADKEGITQRNGNDLHVVLDIPFGDMVLGRDWEIREFWGRESLTIQPNTNPDTVIPYPRGGMPIPGYPNSRGNLYIHLRMKWPKKWPEEIKEALTEWDWDDE